MTTDPKSGEQYLVQAVAEALPGYNVIFEAGFSFDDFVSKYASRSNVAYITYEGFVEGEQYERPNSVVPDVENYSIYLRSNSYENLSEEVRALRQVFRNNARFNGVPVNEKPVQRYAKVVAGFPTIFTKGFDSFEVRVVID